MNMENEDYSGYINFHHFGLAVKKFENAVKFYKNLGYYCSKEVYDEFQNVNLIFCEKNNHPSIELIKPVNKNSPITNYLKISNEIIYHTCYEVFDDFNFERLFFNNRAICVSEPKPAILFNNNLVSFYYVQGVGIIEILNQAKT